MRPQDASRNHAVVAAKADFDLDHTVEQLLPIGAGMPRLPLWDVDDMLAAA